MIIDCHGHYTTAPPQLGEYRDRQQRAVAADPDHVGDKGELRITYAWDESKTFLRGIQRTDTRGVATFRTIYPGYYAGRTVHIHVRVSLGGNVVHTGQLYFPDKVTDAVYMRSPYSSRPGRTTRNPDDAIYRNGGRRSTLRLERRGTGYVASITMGVVRR